MVKTLRYSMIALLAMVCNVAFADAYKTLTFPDGNSEEISAYTKTWTATIGTDTWTIENFNNNKNGWDYIRCGRKGNESVASIATAFAIDKAIGNVTVTIDKITKSKVNSMKLLVASDAEFTSVVETVDAPSIDDGEIMFRPASPAAGKYYKLVFDCAAGTANGLIQISKVQYFEEGNEPVIKDISNAPETAYTVAEAHALIEAGEGLATEVYVNGIITKIDIVDTEKGNAKYYINDTNSDEGALYVYCGFFLKDAEGNDKFTSEDQIKVGDEVVIYGKLKDYNGTHEFDYGNYLYSLNGKTSGISSITADNAEKVIYNLNGQRLQKMQKGINIVNGKKVIVK